MVYKKAYRKKYPAKKKYTKNLKTVIKKVIDSQVEDKWAHNQIVQAGGASATSTPVYHLLTNVQRGVERIHRVGNKIRLKGITLRGYMKGHNSVAAVVRLLLVRVMGVNGVDPTLGQIFSHTTAGQVFFSDFNQNNRGEYFTVLWDQLFNLRIEGGSANIATPQTFVKRYKMKNMAIDYNDGNAGTVADCVRNAYYLIAMSDQQNIANTPEFSLQYTLVFEDA